MVVSSVTRPSRGSAATTRHVTPSISISSPFVTKRILPRKYGSTYLENLSGEAIFFSEFGNVSKIGITCTFFKSSNNNGGPSVNNLVSALTVPSFGSAAIILNQIPFEQ